MRENICIVEGQHSFSPRLFPAKLEPILNRGRTKVFRAGVFFLLLIIAVAFTPGCSNSSTLTPQPIKTQEPEPKDDSDGAPTYTPVKPANDDGTPTISGIPILPDLEIDAGNLTQVILYDLAWNEIDTDSDSDPNYSFDVESGNNYILIADYSSGASLGAVTRSVTGHLHQDISIDTEIAMSLIVATEKPEENLLPRSLSRPLDDLVTDANKAVQNLNDFYENRNENRSADRIADAVHSLILDRLNRSLAVYWSDLNHSILRAYGGGMEGIRSLQEMISNPLPPLNPHFVFTRYNSNNEVDFGMSDLETERWDFMGANSGFPHIVTGGDRIAYIKPTSTWLAAANENILGLYVRNLGSAIDSAQLLTPWNMECWTPSLSPDQSKIAFSGRYIDDPSAIRQAWTSLNIFVVDLKTKAITQITHENSRGVDRFGGCMNPSWSPDGEILAFDYSSGMASEYEDTRIEFVIVNDSDSRTVVMQGSGMDNIWRPTQPRFSPDGAQIVFSANVADESETWDYEIVAIPSDYSFNGGSITMLTDNEYDDTKPDWSCDGRFIIFSSNRGGEPGRLASASAYLNPFYVMSAYDGGLVADLGDFANAGYYYGARFCSTEAVMAAIDGVARNSSGEAIISENDARTSSAGNSDYNYYRETIPAANNIVDAYGSPAYNYGVTSWF